jgi:hypothetical protein
MSIIIYYSIFSILSIAVVLVAYKVAGFQKRESFKDELDYHFKEVWSGREEEKLYAWYHVKLNLLKYGASEREYRYVERKIDELDKESMLSKYNVDESGNIEKSVSSEDMSYL